MSQPQIIVEASFNTGNASSYFTIGDAARGQVGIGVLGPSQVFTDITSYVQSLTLTTGSSSRITTPLVQFVAGTAQILLDNTTRAFDPLNVNSPFWAQPSSVVVTGPNPTPNAQTAFATGQAFDAQVNVSSTGVVMAPAGIATGTGTAYNPTVTGTSSGNTPTGMVFGSSPGGGGQNPETATTNLLAPAMFRSYELYPSTYAGTSYCRYVPAGTAQMASFKPDLTVLSDTTNAGYSAMVTQLQTVCRAFSDLPHVNHWMLVHHEPVGKGWLPGEWQTSQVNFHNDVIVPVNAARTHPLFFTATVQGFVTNAIMDTWFTTPVLNVLDAIGWDCYGYDTGQDQFLRAHDYAAAKGMPWIIPEIGYMTGGTPGGTTSAQSLSAMQSIMGHVNGWTQAEEPLAVLWFNGNSSALGGQASAAAYWKNVCQNSTILP